MSVYDSHAILREAQLADARGEWERSVQLYQDLLEHNPNLQGALHGLAAAQHKLRIAQQVAALCRQAAAERDAGDLTAARQSTARAYQIAEQLGELRQTFLDKIRWNADEVEQKPIHIPVQLENGPPEFDSLLKRLRELVAAANTPNTERQAQRLLDRAGEQVQRWIDYIALVWLADHARRQGDWMNVARLLDLAVKAITPPSGSPPDWALANYSHARQTADAMNRAEGVASLLLGKIRDQYMQMHPTQNSPEPRRVLDLVDRRIQEAVKLAHEAGGMLSLALLASQWEAIMLRRIDEAVQRALAKAMPDERLRVIRDALETCGRDPILEHFESQFVEEFQEQIPEILAEASEAQRYGQWEQALVMLRRVLAHAPQHPNAAVRYTALEAQQRTALSIDETIDANRAISKALELLYRRNFREAAEQLAKAASLQADPARLREVQQIFDGMKSDYRATNIYTIRDLLRKDRFPEALRRIKEEQKKNLDDDLNAELKDLRSEVERRWPGQALAWSRAQLRVARTEADYEAVEAMLRQVVEQLGDFPRRPQIEHEIRQAHIARLNYRLQLIESALSQEFHNPVGGQQPEQAPQSIEEARMLAEQIATEAHDMDLKSVKDRAERLLSDLSTETGKSEQAPESDGMTGNPYNQRITIPLNEDADR